MEEKIQYTPTIVFHPGEMLLEKIQEMNMGPKEFALRTMKPEKTIIAVLKGDSSITAEMSVLFELVTKIPAHYWMNYQRRYDEFIAREKLKLRVDKAVSWSKRFPVGEMIRMGWLPKVSGGLEKTSQMLAFFAFATHEGWEKYYFKQQLKVAFRISLKRVSEPYALTAWLRKGELQAEELTAKKYLPKNFKTVLPKIKALFAHQQPDFFQQLQKICLEAGVKVVHTPRLSKVSISGSTRWLNDTPLIQFSGPIKQNRAFAFTFFHEAGHILLHGKKDIFLEKIEYSDKDVTKEKEADLFAEKWMKDKTQK